ncbi:MAG TPA: glycosyltransferase family 87 protein [Gemmatimonadales bacterium]|nr:glycosyltransferase family 87 protein [Gemmatimonadales bacterium]
MTAIAGREVALKQEVGTDFHVHWQGGYDFVHGLPVYQPLPGARRFNYPPFAAQVFQVYGILPMKLAAWLSYLASVALFYLAIRISRRLIRAAAPAWSPSLVPLVLAVLCSAVFVLENLVHIQVNLLLLALCLLGVEALVRGREVAAGGWLVAAAAIKLTPAFFVLWAMIRGTRRTLVSVFAFAALCLALPVAQRGWHQGMLDLSAYHQGFLQKFAAGHIITDERNQNLAAMIYRAAVPEPAGYAYLQGLAGAAPLLYRILAATILAALLIRLFRLRIGRQPFSPLEVASVFLASHLLSGITWKAHLVSLFFVSYAFFSLEWRRLSQAGRVGLGLAWAGIAAIAPGRDLTGSRLHHDLAGYSVYVWVMLLLFTLSVGWKPVGSGDQ